MQKMVLSTRYESSLKGKIKKGVSGEAIRLKVPLCVGKGGG